MVRLAIFLVVAFNWLTLGQCFSDPCPDPPYNNGLAKSVYTKIEAVKPFIENGVPKYGIPSLDPLGPLPGVAFSLDNDYIRLNGTVNNTVIHNLAEFITCEVTINLGVRPKFFLEFRLSEFLMEGDYDMNGVYVSIFPIFGSGNYSVKVFNASTSGGAKVSYNIITRHAQIHDLELNLGFDKLEIYMECILGCGDMADFVNNFLSEIATTILTEMWNYANPILTNYLEDTINHFLKDMKILPTPQFSSAGYDSKVDRRLPENQQVKFQFPLDKIFKQKNRI